MNNSIIATSIQINDKCNLRCSHCVAYESDQITQSMELKDFKSTIFKLKNYGLKQVAFILKEPMMYPDIFEAIRYCSNSGMETEIITNGTLISKENVGQLIESGITVINISIEGISDKTNDSIRGKGTFNKVIENIKLLQNECDRRRTFIPIVIKLTLNTFNMHEVQDMAMYFQNLGINEVRFNAITLEGNAKNNTGIKLSNKELSDCVEVLVSSYSQIKNLQYSIVLNSLRPLAYIYYNIKYKLNLMVNYPSCISLHKTFSLNAQGSIYACSNNYNEIERNDKKVIQIPNSDSLQADDITEFLSQNKKFHDESKRIFNMEKLCPSCLLNLKCQPCQLKEQEQVVQIIDDCNFYMSKIKKLVTGATVFVLELKNSAYITIEENTYVCVNAYPNGKYFINNISNEKSQWILKEVVSSGKCLINNLDRDEDIKNTVLRLLLTDCFYIDKTVEEII
ncbi:MAG: radical SAM protein [Lachnotalea sp.]